MIRDPRRCFTASQKRAMLIRQLFACADCRRPFDRLRPGSGVDRWTGYPPVFHHVIPHADGGRTSLDNGLALCRHCHHWGRDRKRHPSWCHECRDASS
jgi:HNH endonuclease